MQTLRDYREFIRLHIGIRTPKEAGLAGAIAGDEPPWQKEPSNYKLNMFIANACRIVNQHVGLAGDSTIKSVPIAAQTTDGPFMVDLSSVPGFPQRSVISIRRAWWNDGTTPVKLWPVVLSELDRSNDPYLADAEGTPYKFAVEGNTLFLMPTPASAGTLQFMTTNGTIAPVTDEEPFEGIPDSYDPCLLYIAIVDYGKSLPADAEMASRAQAYTDDAAAGLDRLKTWYNGGGNEEAGPSMMFDARPFRRNIYGRR